MVAVFQRQVLWAVHSKPTMSISWRPDWEQGDLRVFCDKVLTNKERTLKANNALCLSGAVSAASSPIYSFRPSFTPQLFSEPTPGTSPGTGYVAVEKKRKVSLSLRSFPRREDRLNEQRDTNAAEKSRAEGRRKCCGRGCNWERAKGILEEQVTFKQRLEEVREHRDVGGWGRGFLAWGGGMAPEDSGCLES